MLAWRAGVDLRTAGLGQLDCPRSQRRRTGAGINTRSQDRATVAVQRRPGRWVVDRYRGPARSGASAENGVGSRHVDDLRVTAERVRRIPDPPTVMEMRVTGRARWSAISLADDGGRLRWSG